MKKEIKQMAAAAAAVLMAAALSTPALADYQTIMPVGGSNPLIMPVAADIAPEMIVNGAVLTDAPAAYKLEDGSWMVPLRAVAEALGYTITYRPDIAGVDVQKGKLFSSIFFGRNEYFINRTAPIALESAPVLKPGVTYVPLSFFEKVYMEPVVSSQGELIIGKDTRPIILGADIGEEFPITLEENPSTGCIWTVTMEPADGVTIVKDEYIAPEASDMVGVPGTHEWLFRADAAGEYTLTFVYARPYGDAVNTLVYKLLVEDVAGGQEHLPEDAE